MGLEKAIAHGKEHRKPYYDSRAVSGECRNQTMVGVLGVPATGCMVLKSKNRQQSKN